MEEELKAFVLQGLAPYKHPREIVFVKGDTYGKRVQNKSTEQDGSGEEIIAISFNDKDWKVLEDFAKYAAELQEDSSLVKDGIPTSLTVTWNENEGLKAETQLPPKESMIAMLELLRPFILEGERTNFNKVRNIIKRAAAGSKRVKQHLDTLQTLYSGQRLQSVFVAGRSTPDYPEGKIINSEETFDLYLNAYRFHRDEEKRAEFDALHKTMPQESSIALFLLMIADKVEAILALQALANLLMGGREVIFPKYIPAEPRRYLAYLHATIFSFLPVEIAKECPIPEGKLPFERVIDLTHLGPSSVTHFLDLVGRMWMHRELVAELGQHHYLFRVGKGFSPPNDAKIHERETDIYAGLMVQALVAEHPFFADRRQPAAATLEKMRMAQEGKTSRKVSLKPFDTAEALEAFLNVEPQPIVEWIIVPRIAFKFAYWPASEQAKERAKKIVSEGREPTFEEVEGSISRAWEIFEEDEEKDP